MFAKVRVLDSKGSVFGDALPKAKSPDWRKEKQVPILSKRTRYALHGVGYIAAFAEGKPVPLDRILKYLKIYSRHLTLSSGYIRKIFQDISRAGLIQATFGPRGGYSLGRAAEEIKLLDIVEVLEGPIFSDCCLLSSGIHGCPVETNCGVRKIIHGAEMALYRFLHDTTVETLTKEMVFPDGPANEGKPGEILTIESS